MTESFRPLAATRGLLAASLLALAPLAWAQSVQEHVHAHGGTVVNISAPITVNGVSDPEEAATLVVTRLSRTFDRLDAGGALG